MNLLSQSQKHQILRDMPEVEMHKKLKILFEKVYPNRQVYIGQGTGEFGKDLVIIENDPISGEKVTALVVKMGDLSGSASNSMVGTINTQINQAVNIGTYFKDIGREVIANEVIVVIFGTVSQNATKTLHGYLKQFENIVKIRSIEDMTRLFETYHDEIFVINNHIDVLHKKYEELDAMLFEKNKLLSRCYIEPNLQSFENTKKNIVMAQNKENISSETIAETVFGRKDSLSSIYDLASQHKRYILIQGEAGCGKSIFSIKIVQHAIQKIIRGSDINLDQAIFAPVLLRATKIKQASKEDLQSAIVNYYSDSPSAIKPNIILIDGIDEISENDRKHLVELAENYCDEHSISLIVTSRKNQDIAKELSNFSYFEILPFELSQAMEFIKRMAEKNQKLMQGLLKNIEQFQHQIPMTAMSLALLIEIAEKHNEIPASITDLYERYINMIIGVDDRNAEINQLFEPRYKLDFLTTISYELFYQHDDSTVTKASFFDYLDEYTSKHSHISSKEDFLTDLKRVSILSINGDSVTFSHKSFLDYFIAKYFAKNAEELFRAKKFDDLYHLYYTALWEDVTTFYFGFKNSINKEQIDLLIEHNPFKEENEVIYHIGLYSIGRLLQYAWNTNTNIKKYGIDKAISNIYALRDVVNTFNKKNYGFGLPRIFADATVMHYTDFFFSSNFLQKEILELIDDKFTLLRDSGGNADISNELYFFSLYFLVNSKRIEVAHIERFIGLLMSESANIEPQAYFPIMNLFKIFIKNTKIEVTDEKKADLDKIAKTFKRKYQDIFEDNYLFKNRIEARKHRALSHRKK